MTRNIPRRDGGGLLPDWVEDVFYRYFTSELATRSKRGVNICPVMHLYDGEWKRIIVTTSIAYVRKAENLRRDPRAALLFSDPTGSGLENHGVVLVQGLAKVYDEDPEALWKEFTRNPESMDRYTRPPKTEIVIASLLKLGSWPASKLMDWYLRRIVIEIDIERVYAWKKWEDDAYPEEYGLVG